MGNEHFWLTSAVTKKLNKIKNTSQYKSYIVTFTNTFVKKKFQQANERTKRHQMLKIVGNRIMSKMSWL